MMRTLLIIVCSATAAGLFTGCVVGEIGGNPDLPLSNTNGTVRIFQATLAETTVAITNAFADHRYREMMLYNSASGQSQTPPESSTHRFTLEPTLSVDGSIARIPVRGAPGTTLPYKAYFLIGCAISDTNQTCVTVRTILSEVIDGKEPGIHGGWANHYRKVPPVKREEDSVLAAIAKELDLQMHKPEVKGLPKHP